MDRRPVVEVIIIQQETPVNKPPTTGVLLNTHVEALNDIDRADRTHTRPHRGRVFFAGKAVVGAKPLGILPALGPRSRVCSHCGHARATGRRSTGR